MLDKIVLETTPTPDSWRALRGSPWCSITRRFSAASAAMVGSAVAAEGKTLTTTNVALTLSHSSIGALLIDADLRRPSAHEMFGP